jgi:hypothetical protein
MTGIYHATILAKYRVAYYYCDSCGFLRTERPNWLNEAYSSAIAASDTGAVTRNIQISKALSSLLFLAFHDHGKGQWLDYAGGHGLLTRLMRDKGFNFHWADMYASNIFAQGFEHEQGMTYDGVTAIEALEHMEDPMAFLENLSGLSPTRTVILTTELCPSPPPKPEQWWYFGLNTGQHISFFQERTLETIATRLGVRYMRAGRFHMFSQQLPSTALARLSCSRLSVFFDFLASRCLDSRLVADHECAVDRQKPACSSKNQTGGEIGKHRR